MIELDSLFNKLHAHLEDAREDKKELRDDVNEQLIKMGCTQEEIESNWTKVLVIQRLKESTSEKEIKILLNDYTKLCQERTRIITLTKIIRYINELRA